MQACASTFATGSAVAAKAQQQQRSRAAVVVRATAEQQVRGHPMGPPQGPGAACRACRPAYPIPPPALVPGRAAPAGPAGDPGPWTCLGTPGQPMRAPRQRLAADGTAHPMACPPACSSLQQPDGAGRGVMQTAATPPLLLPPQVDRRAALGLLAAAAAVGSVKPAEAAYGDAARVFASSTTNKSGAHARAAPACPAPQI